MLPPRGRSPPKVYRTHADLLADKTIDAVFVATPDHLHRRIVMDALRAGKDVYLRKADDVLDCGRARHHSGCARETVNWEMFLGDSPKQPFSLERFFRWRCYEDYSGGIASDSFVELCTSIHYLLEVPAPTRVMAMGQRYRWGYGREVPDTVNAILEYPRGFVVNLSATFNNQSRTALHFLGTEGTLKLDDEGLDFEPEEPRAVLGRRDRGTSPRGVRSYDQSLDQGTTHGGVGF
jgi:predicted dehydrogenase